MSKTVHVRHSTKTQSQYDKFDEKRESIIARLKEGKLSNEQAMWELRYLGFGRQKSAEIVNKNVEKDFLDWRNYPLHNA